ncbi:MAG: hypothetical protein UW73_C0011G0010 [Microgenomates group bacterium GW2011_GWB1_44_8]|nr:MAG: hypothetical protein UW73_C0011G0010 [Microgenomates group bacterium GW2011_GWB1_44_8]
MGKIVSTVAILGFADTKENEPLYWAVYQVAKKVAEAGYVVVEGAGPGLMLAAGKGAKDGGGKVIGVTLSAKDIPNFRDRDPNNPIDEEIKTTNYVERTLKLMEIGDAYIVFKGGSGTISEWGMAWGLARLYFGHHKPLILYGGHWYPIMETLAKNMPLRNEELRVYEIATTPEQVIESLRRFEKRIEEGDRLDGGEQTKGLFSL